MQSGLISKAHRHGGSAVLGIDRKIFQPWDTWKNLHKSPAARLYGLGDDGDGSDDALVPLTMPADVPDLTPATPPPYAGVATSPGMYVTPSLISSPPVTSAPSAADSSLLSSILNFAAFKSGGIVLNPRPGQVVNQASANYALGMSKNTLLMIGAAVVGLFLLAKKG